MALIWFGCDGGEHDSIATAMRSITHWSDTYHFVQVTLELSSSEPQIVTAGLAPCPNAADCPSKHVTFNFVFRDPNAVRAVSFAPMSEYLYGGTPLAIKIKNLPHDTVVDRVKVEFHVNVTAKKIDFSQGLPVVSVQIPRSSTALKIPLSIVSVTLKSSK